MHIKKIIAGLAISTTFSVGLGTPTVSANEFYCDNDRASNQYPYCYNTYYGPWSYGTYYRDLNGDHRLLPPGNDYTKRYYWRFTGTLDTTFFNGAAYLAHPSFTNPAAIYDIGSNSYDYPARVIANINQNTAPYGWNNFNYGPDTPFGQNSNFYVALDPGGASGQYTGADAVKVWSTGQYGFHSSLKEEAYNRNSKIASIQKKMLDAIDNYQDIRGSFQVVFTNNRQNESVNFMVSEGSVPGSYVKITRKDGTVTVKKSDGSSMIDMNQSKKTFTKKNITKASKPIGPRHYKDEKGQSVYVQRQDPAWANMAREVTHPQNYAYWLTSVDNKIVGHKKLLNREVTVIEGKHDAYMSKKLGATTYKMWVDTKTGVLLKLEGKDSKGKVLYFIKVNDIKFNQGIDKTKFAIQEPKGWKNLSLNK